MDNSIVQELLDFLDGRGVDPKDLYDVLNKVLKESNVRYWIPCTISVPILYALKDIIWYNMEHVPQGGPQEGVSTLGFLGTKFPVFAKIGLEDVYIDPSNVVLLHDELNQIMRAWSAGLVRATLNISSRESIMDNPGKMVVKLYDVARHNPYDVGYGSFNRGNGLLDKLGRHIINSEDALLCLKESTVGEFEGKTFYNQLLTLREATRQAKGVNKGVRLDIS